MKKMIVTCILKIILVIGFGFFASWQIYGQLAAHKEIENYKSEKTKIAIEQIRDGTSKLDNHQIANLIQVVLDRESEVQLIDYLHKYLMIFLVACCSILIFFMVYEVRVKIKKIGAGGI